MKRFLIASTFAVILALSTGFSAPASANSPVFGNAKIAVMSANATKQVTAKGGYTAYYLYYGMLYTSYALQYAGLSQYYNYYGYNGTAGTYAYYAYSNSAVAASYYYNAYYYQSY